MTKAHNLYKYLKEKYGGNIDNDRFSLYVYNMSDEEFDIAIQDPVYEHEGLLPEWD